MKKIWKITQYVLSISIFLITIFEIFLINDLGLTIRGILLTLYFGSMILEDKLADQTKVSERIFQIFRTIAIILVLLLNRI